MGETPRIGAYVLESLTRGMYRDCLDAIREYVQNSVDAIREAEEQTILRQGEGRIEFEIDPKARRLVIRDNGTGIEKANAARRLLDIGMSSKRIETDAGFRGIGRLAGIAFCSSIMFRTTAFGEPEVTELTIDCLGVLKAISPATRQTEELAEVISKFSRVEYGSCKSPEHFFEVIMEGVTEDRFLDWKVLEDYLSQVVPVEFDAHRFVWAKKIYDWVKAHDLSLPMVTLIIKTPETQRQVFKPYRSHYKTARTRDAEYQVDITDIGFYPEDPGPDPAFWIWYGKSELLGTLGDERAAGLRFRKNNIAIGGPDRVAELFAEGSKTNGRFNAWYIGEIHVLSAGAVPNARRDGFEEADDWPKIKEAIMPFIRERVAEIREASEARNRPTAKVLVRLNGAVSNVKDRLSRGLASKEERDSLLRAIEKEGTVALRTLETRATKEETDKIREVLDKLDELHQELENAPCYGVRNVRSNLDRKQRKVLQTVLEVLYRNLTTNGCARGEECYKILSAAITAEFQAKNGTPDHE